MDAISSTIQRKKLKKVAVVVPKEGSEESGEEILYHEILARLPAKSLMRFRSVCKSWSSLIRDPSFVKEHHRHFPRRNDRAHLFLTTSDENVKPYQHFFSIQINQSGELSLLTRILTLPASGFIFLAGSHSVNGLFLVSERSSQSDRENVLMINPCTREVVKLPHADQVATTTNANVVHRLGFSALANEYKVLRVHQTDKDMKFKILTLSTRSWRDLDLEFSHLHPLGPGGFCLTERSAWLRGGMHWLHRNRNVVVVFDFEEERFRVLPLPSLEPDSEWENVIEVNGCLAVLGKRKLVNHKIMYKLDDYQNHVWVKEEAIQFDLWSINILGTINTGDLLLSSTTGDIDLYNFENKRWYKAKIPFPNCKRIGISCILGSYDENIQPITT